MSFNVKSNNSNKTAASPNDRRDYVKLYGSINQLEGEEITLYDNIYNYSRVVIIGYIGNDPYYGYYNLNYDIIPEIVTFSNSQTILLNNNDMRQVLVTIKYCSISTNIVVIAGQLRKSDTISDTLNINAIYGIR